MGDWTFLAVDAAADDIILRERAMLHRPTMSEPIPFL
jgi:hypothetical protein